MPANQAVSVSLLKAGELEEADRIFRVAFAEYLGNPDFLGDRDLMRPRWRSPHVRILAARENGRLIGSNVVTRWGSFGFFGPLTVLPAYWDRGVGQRLLQATIELFERWGVRHTGLYTFAGSRRHLSLYQKFGYYPRYLTAIMTRTPALDVSAAMPTLLSTLTRAQRAKAIQACARLTNGVDKGLDLSGEMSATLAQRGGDVVLCFSGSVLDAFAVCLTGPGSEGGEKECYVKFGAARAGKRASERFGHLLNACDQFAASREVKLEAGVNLAREQAYQRMLVHGYRVSMYGIGMQLAAARQLAAAARPVEPRQRPPVEGFDRADAWVIADWR